MRFMVTRYNNETWGQLLTYRENQIESGGMGLHDCIYCAPIRVKESIPVNELMIVFEMNNDTNEVMGLGLVKNYVYADKKYPIYKDKNYHRYIYKGKYRIKREDMKEKEEIYMKIFDLLLFKGKTHLKRGQGLSEIPEKLYGNIKIGKDPIINLIREMFKVKDRFALPKTSVC